MKEELAVLNNREIPFEILFSIYIFLIEWGCEGIFGLFYFLSFLSVLVFFINVRELVSFLFNGCCETYRIEEINVF